MIKYIWRGDNKSDWMKEYSGAVINIFENLFPNAEYELYGSSMCGGLKLGKIVIFDDTDSNGQIPQNRRIYYSVPNVPNVFINTKRGHSVRGEDVVAFAKVRDSKRDVYYGFRLINP